MPYASKRPSRSPLIAALLIAIVALGVAIGAWFRPTADNKPSPTPPAPTYTDSQVASAKAAVCAAYAKVRKAGDIAGTRNGGSDPTATLATATSTRQVLGVGSRYLTTKLAEEPATPPELAVAVRKLANTYQELVVDYLAEAGDSELNPLLRAGDEAHVTIERLCK
ncbi:hypothetical protein LRC484719_30580 [Mycobacterium riyadhense]